jgi:hypothetical protein
MFQSCQTDLSHLRSKIIRKNEDEGGGKSRRRRRQGGGDGGSGSSSRGGGGDMSERIMFEEEDDDDDDVNNEEEETEGDEDEDLAEIEEEEDYEMRNRMSQVSSVSSSIISSSPAGDERGSEYEAAEMERQERLKQRHGARMRFDLIDPELSEATVGSPPKVGFGVPRLALEILRSSPRQGSTSSDGATPSPDQTIGTLSPDPTKMMADISSPRSAFSRHSSKAELLRETRDVLKDTTSEVVCPDAPRLNYS